ncbi:MAG TPA: transglutaminase-like domain-containing protein [Candidatus Eisenbacteria bacterium]|jgi:regulator of sirC expression with transglutaminase-like and TPR domain
MSDPALIRQHLLEMLQRPDAQIDLARAALLVAAENDPSLDVDAEMERLERWAGELNRRIDPSWNNLQRLARLRTFMYEDLGFKGDVRGYYSPANSLLHSVMSRRLGIPLTLSIVFMEIGWRIGVPFEGVGFPGHFLVRLTGEPGDLLLDPYDHGASVHEDDCRRMIQLTTGGTVPYDASMIRSLGKRDMIGRLLFNLKVACLKAGDDVGALSAVERLLLLHPNDPPELRDRGLLLYRMDRYRDARISLEAYLRARPQALDREVIERHLSALDMMLALDPPPQA